jgi:hypothetical protein
MNWTAPFHTAHALARHWAKVVLGRSPSLYYPLFRHRRGYRSLLVTDETDICIEGFPRSANSFAVGAFESVNPDAEIAHHGHVPAQIIRACQLGLPTIVLIRDPLEAVISLYALQLQNKAHSGSDSWLLNVSFKHQLLSWLSFYERVGAVHADLVLAPFETVVTDFGQVIDFVNRRYGTDFAVFQHTDVNVDEIRTRRGYHALPSERRDRLKQQARRRFERELGGNHDLVQRAYQCFDDLVTHSPLVAS